MRIAVIGTGYVGLTTGAGFSDFGNDVAMVGLDAGAIERLQAGDVELYEPGLADLVRSNVEGGRISFTTDLEAAVREAEVVMTALKIVPDRNGAADLAELFAVADRIGKVLDSYKVIATRSTVPVGTADRLAVRIGAHSSTPFGVVSNPAFLKEGDAVNDFLKPDRVVVGTSDQRAVRILERLYAPLIRTPERLIVVDARSAELAKYAASALLATRISFMNELAGLAEELGADIERVRQIMGADPRIGPEFLFVGPGFGGTLFQRDIAFLLASAREAGRDLGVTEATWRANERQKQLLVHKLTRQLGDLGDKVVGLWGLSFKPRTDDVGGGPALALIDALLERGARVQVHDPAALERARALYGDRLVYADSMYEAAAGADALVLVTEWHQYRNPDFGRIAQEMRGKLVVDGRNVWLAEQLRENGLRYVGVGR
jgi:UDPglucose 6-dehydrogenase